MRSIRGRRERTRAGAQARAWASALAVAFAGALALGCSNDLPPPIGAAHPDGAEPRRGGMLTVATFGDLRSLDPVNIADGISPTVLENVLAGLVDFDADGNVVPDLAESFTTEDDGRTYHFVLRKGALFQDGDEVTADDVKRSVERALDPAAPNPNASFYESLAGYSEFRDKKKEHLDAVEVGGRYVVAFHLKEPDATFLPLLAMPILRPVCKSAGSHYSDTWHVCGAGPFKLPEGGWDQGRSVTLVRHEGYFRPGLPYLDAFRLLLHVNPLPQRFKLERGELDILRDFLSPDVLRFQADPRWSPFGAFEIDKQVLGESMNAEMPPFDNVEIRRAVAAAIDRDAVALVRAANLRPTNQLVPPGVFGHDATLAGQRYDYQAALEHMRRAGYPYDPETKTGGWPEVVPYYVYKQGLAEFTAQVVQQQLAKIGLRIELRVVNYPTFLAIRGRRKQAPFGPGFWQQDYPEAESFLEPLFHSKSINDEDSNNWSFYKNPRVDELIDRARHELDRDRRKRIYSETQQILCDDAPWAFTASYRWFSQQQPYVKDWRPHPIYTYEMSRTWLDRASGPIASRALFGGGGRSALGSLFGAAP